MEKEKEKEKKKESEKDNELNSLKEELKQLSAIVQERKDLEKKIEWDKINLMQK